MALRFHDTTGKQEHESGYADHVNLTYFLVSTHVGSIEHILQQAPRSSTMSSRPLTREG